MRAESHARVLESDFFFFFYYSKGGRRIFFMFYGKFSYASCRTSGGGNINNYYYRRYTSTGKNGRSIVYVHVIHKYGNSVLLSRYVGTSTRFPRRLRHYYFRIAYAAQANLYSHTDFVGEESTLLTPPPRLYFSMFVLCIFSVFLSFPPVAHSLVSERQLHFLRGVYRAHATRSNECVLGVLLFLTDKSVRRTLPTRVILRCYSISVAQIENTTRRPSIRSYALFTIIDFCTF